MFRRSTLVAVAALVGASFLALSVSTADAGGYPQRDCASGKLKGAAKYCKSTLKALGKFQKTDDATKLANSLSKAGEKLDKAYDKANDKALKKDVDCTLGPADRATTQAMLDAEAASIDALILDGVPAGSSDERTCRSSLLGAAAKLCGGMLKGEALYLKKYDTDLLGTKRTTIQGKASSKFTTSYGKATGKPGCPAITEQDIRDAVAAATDGSLDDVHGVQDTADASFTTYIPTPNPSIPLVYEGENLFPKCSRDFNSESTYLGFYRKGSVNKLLVYYQGGGACWNTDSCNLAQTFKQSAGPGDDPSFATTGFADYNNPLNPFKDWHVVFVPYCTGDVHTGNSIRTGLGNPLGLPGNGRVNHVGRVNAKAMEKLARDLFVDPEQVYVTGTSAGAYGALLNSFFLINNVYPASKFDVLGDAGDGVITLDWYNSSFTDASVWNFQETANSDPLILDVFNTAAELITPKSYEKLATTFADHDFANFASRYDGSGGGQTAFFHVMSNPSFPICGNDLLCRAGFLNSVWPQWWESQCAWDAGRAAQNLDVIANTSGNYATYVGAGSEHGMFGSDKVYTDLTGVSITIRDWIQQQIDDDPLWTSVICSDGNCDPIATCNGGSNAGLDCSTNGDADCPGGSCNDDPYPEVDTCQGGSNNGGACVDDGDCPDGLCADGSPYLANGTVDCPYPY